MNTRLRVLQCGSCEPLKVAVHGTVLGLAALCLIYNAAAWLSRRERHLGINTILYSALTIWEWEHVAHHVAALRRCSRQETPVPPEADAEPRIDTIAA
jgi:hypothetical protein